jgi:hypothetical protein
MLSVISQGVNAGVYKWVDENGKVHYGSVPGSASAKSVVVQESNKKKNSGHRNLRVSGRWYAKKNSHVTLKYVFNYDKFFLFEYISNGSSYRSREVGKGKLSQSKNILELTYFEHFTDEAKLDSVERYEIVAKSNNSLVLLSENFKEMHLKRTSSQGNQSQDIKGKWRLGNLLYEFEGSKFFVKNSKKLIQIGSWRMQDPKMTLDFVADFVKPVDHRQGKTNTWIKKFVNYNSMGFVSQETGETLNFVRVAE